MRVSMNYWRQPYNLHMNLYSYVFKQNKKKTVDRSMNPFASYAADVVDVVSRTNKIKNKKIIQFPFHLTDIYMADGPQRLTRRERYCWIAFTNYEDPIQNWFGYTIDIEGEHIPRDHLQQCENCRTLCYANARWALSIIFYIIFGTICTWNGVFRCLIGENVRFTAVAYMWATPASTVWPMQNDISSG